MHSGETTRVAVIMAGGSGERFWPLSRKNRPKQLLRLTDPMHTMLDQSIACIAPFLPPPQIYVQTGAHLQEAIREAGLPIPRENILAEPCKRNTSGCLAWAAAHMLAQYGGDGRNISMAILTADHAIGDPPLFRATVDAALTAAEGEPVLVTLGIVPARPATGYGYIQVEHGPAAVDTPGGIPVLSVKAFHEKPTVETAQQYLDADGYYWNSGMFFWRISAFLEELDETRPELSLAVRDMAAAMAGGDERAARRVFEGLENISIDFALMEKARRVAMVPASFPWDDIGTWTALERTRDADASGNVSQGDPVLIDCTNAIVYNADGAGRMAVSVIGVDGLVVVTTHDAVLVVPKDRSEEVKKAVEELRRRGSGHV